MHRIKTYYQLVKPGIVYGNALTIIAGFFLATSTVSFHLSVLLGVLIGTSIIIASACVMNNVIDRRIDKLMARTKNRAIVSGEVSVVNAVTYSVILGVVGFVILALSTNWLTFVLGMIAYIFYVVIYGISKRSTEHGTLIGSVSGALPPVAGYTAVTNRIDLGAMILFIILVFWQMAHFYAIAIYRRKEYARAHIPILTVTRGIRPARIQIVMYIVGFILASIDLSFARYTGLIYAVVIIIVGLWWLIVSVQQFSTTDEKLQVRHAKKLFRISLIVNLVMCLMIAIGGYLS
jgi:protoheme IX farnesyltransferase